VVRAIVFTGSSYIALQLFILQIHANSFGTGHQGKMVWYMKAFHRLRVQDVTEFDSD
jgi:hypothetical protein